MVEARVKSRIWVQALMRRAQMDGYMSTIVHSGDEDAGAVLIKLNRFAAGCVVYSQVRDEHGAPAWLRGTGAEDVAEADADAYVQRQLGYDADLWVIEIEDPKGSYSFDGRILDN